MFISFKFGNFNATDIATLEFIYIFMEDHTKQRSTCKFKVVTYSSSIKNINDQNMFVVCKDNLLAS